MMNFLKNSIKYISSLSISLVGSETFKFASSLYIYKITGDFWLVTILYLLIQIPSLIIYLLSSKITSLKFNNKYVLFFCDVLSFLTLGILLTLFFVLPKSESKAFSIILITFSTILGFIHSLRFIYLKNIVYYITYNNKQLHNINILSTFGTSFGFLISSILTILLYNKLDFFILIIANMITYIISGLLYLWLSLSSTKTKFDSENKEIQKNKTTTYKWIFILSSSFIIGIFLMPRNANLTPFFKYINSNEFKIDEWGSYLNLIFSAFSLIGTLLNYWIFNSIKKKVNINYILFPLLITNILWLIFGYINNTQVHFYSYLSIVAIQQILFSIFLSTFYSMSYILFDKSKFHTQNGISLALRIIFYSVISITSTFITIYSSYYFSFLFFTIVIGILCFISIFGNYKIKRNELKTKQEQN
ncbi:hypothetical protein RRG55_00960 [Mycoplasmopsis felis]|uniref:hypothetical protein n=1 Tax=Mycoplasmopsis felis TaxID=33923 RepID=UPI002AFEEC08|nr:hypothetical protein [Mycoplasmopsis felis]WQQ03742.1 hypothetical protein RRG47_02825 [Mycoplasmopsis felis]